MVQKPKKEKEIKYKQCQYCHEDITSKTITDINGGGLARIPCVITRGPSEKIWLHNRCLKKMIAWFDEKANEKRNRMPENKTVS